MAKNKEVKKRNPWIDAICKITWPQTGKVFKYFRNMGSKDSYATYIKGYRIRKNVLSKQISHTNKRRICKYCL